MNSYSRVAAVTGSNKGIGLACVRQLALQYPKSSFNNGSLLIYLTARNQERGEAALQSIQEDDQLRSAKALRSHGGYADVKYLTLDIESEQSIKNFAEQIKQQHPDGIDILINNAGVAVDGFDADTVKRTLACNYFGTLEAIRQLLPHIREGGRIVNVASTAGMLGSDYSDTIRSRFLKAKTVDEMTNLMNEFQEAVESGDWQKNWPTWGYGVSKAGEIGMSRAIASEIASSGSKTLLNACCPGYVNTDMTKGNGVRTTDQGAETPVFLALDDIKGSNGAFWSDKSIKDWA